MLTVEDYERIRRKVKVEGHSQREAARQLGHSRKTVKKALKHGSPPPYRRSTPTLRPAIDPVKNIIDAWLEEDTRRPRKQRHSAQRIWERLCDEYGFTGSASAVRRYVAYRRKTGGEVFFPLYFDPGEEGQVDWGEAWAIMAGLWRKVFLFCLRLCHSTASFVRAYECEKLEMFFDGHLRAFEYFGGVVNRLAYDNLKSAVITVGKGQDRKLNQRFLELRSHYLFQSRFCNVASGNEKGYVENLVKLSQRKFMTPLPEVADLEELNAHLLGECQRDLERVPERREKTRRQLLAEEQPLFLPLPETPFEACRRISTMASKQSLARFETNDYSVPVQWAHHQVLLKAFADRVELFVGDECVAIHRRNWNTRQYVLDYQHYIPLLERKPGGIHNGRPFRGEPWGNDLERMHEELKYRYGGEGTRRFVNILLLFSRYDEREVKEAVRA